MCIRDSLNPTPKYRRRPLPLRLKTILAQESTETCGQRRPKNQALRGPLHNGLRGHATRSFIRKSPPRASYPWSRTCLIQTSAKPRETRPGGWESASEKNRKACGAESRGKERKAQQSGCNRTCVPQVASKCSCKKQEGICGTSIQPVWQRGPDTMTGRKEAGRL